MCTALISSGDDAYSSFAKHSGLTNILYSLQNTCSVTREIEKEGEINAAPFEVEWFVQHYKMLLKERSLLM